MRKRHGWAIFLILTLFFSITPGRAEAQAPTRLRVGLHYDTSALGQVSVAATEGLVLGYDNGHQWPQELWKVKGRAAWSVRPAAIKYYVASNNLPDREAALALRDLSDKSFLIWTGSHWQVGVGRLGDISEAGALQEDLESIFPQYAWSVARPAAGSSELGDGNGRLIAILPGQDIYLASADAGFITLAGKPYRGWLQLNQVNGRYRVINYIDLEDYLQGVVPREMSPSQPLEALKAQAVASRSFAVTNRKHAAAGFDLCAGTCCQVFDHTRETARSNQAVQETRGMVVAYGGAVVPAYFHADAGGHTENPLYVWSSPLGYLRAVPEPYAVNSPYSSWQERLTAGEIKELLAAMGKNVGNVLGMEALAYTQAGRVERLKITGSAGSTILEKEQIRLNLRLRSRVYTVKPDVPALAVLSAAGSSQALNVAGLQTVGGSGQKMLLGTAAAYYVQGNGVLRQTPAQANTYLFSGSGFGHGVGMSQWGAYTMAANGHSYEEIIQYYFKDVEIIKLGD